MPILLLACVAHVAVRQQRTLARVASVPVAVQSVAIARPTFVRPPATMPIAREFGRAKRTMGDALRVVLIFDAWNPLLSVAERRMVTAMAEAARTFGR